MSAFIVSTTCFVSRGKKNNFLQPTTSPRRRPRNIRKIRNNNTVRCELDQNTILAVLSAMLGIGGGIGLVAFTENQGERSDVRGQTMPCVECVGSGRVECNICKGTGMDPLADKDPSRDGPCTYCEGAKMIKCFNCAGNGIQPRFLDRLSPEDFMD